MLFAGANELRLDPRNACSPDCTWSRGLNASRIGETAPPAVKIPAAGRPLDLATRQRAPHFAGNDLTVARFHCDELGDAVPIDVCDERRAPGCSAQLEVGSFVPIGIEHAQRSVVDPRHGQFRFPVTIQIRHRGAEKQPAAAAEAQRAEHLPVGPQNFLSRFAPAYENPPLAVGPERHDGAMKPYVAACALMPPDLPSGTIEAADLPVRIAKYQHARTISPVDDERRVIAGFAVRHRRRYPAE
ncbi:MAG: hypothetical protein BWY06_03316 [Candidatus Latescibacteria bacterium ADurb.Bin168]|nr:MAG: hypothetical protein BWY06_03316 [Candidatus Latescibacteria bacterium ADurb.Bin168]